MTTPYEIQKCKEILEEISPHIPARNYVKPVQEIMKRKGLEVPEKWRIINTRAGRVRDLDIVLALAEISAPRDKRGKRVAKRQYEIDESKRKDHGTMNLFDKVPVR